MVLLERRPFGMHHPQQGWLDPHAMAALATPIQGSYNGSQLSSSPVQTPHNQQPQQRLTDANQRIAVLDELARLRDENARLRSANRRSEAPKLRRENEELRTAMAVVEDLLVLRSSAATVTP